ncbi:MAG: thioredoxin domain-containing protein [Actinobacteria bacterium]|nr:thioredoxin domain-containing protein [Actinomycetota bacterium]
MNRLAETSSPYLLQHAENPVDWYPWGAEAFARARADDRPLLVSVGYSSCHWCHVMEHESFSDRTTAALMNELFVNVKVDREERPDVDALTMDACVTMTGQGGWPTTVFMTPEGQPFYAGTYFPPEPRHGIPSFRQLLEAIATAWRERRDELEAQATRLVEALGRAARLEAAEGTLSPAVLDDAVGRLREAYEPAFGGFGSAPKFPPASAVEFLLRRGGDDALAIVRGTLDGMAAGGLYDIVGGGFHRYSVDARWLVPHFEKMLYDNALLASAYLHAWVVTGEERYRKIVEETLGYLLREMQLESGGLASAQDADTEGVEGFTYTWTSDEWEGLGLDPVLLSPFEHGRRIVRGTLDDETKARLLTLRASRKQPFRDDKAIASWNGLALAALAEAARRLDREDWLDAATRLGAFLLADLRGDDGRVVRSIRDGRVSGAGYLDDHANVAHGLLELHVATGDLRWLLEARRIADVAIDLFADEEHSGFFLAPRDGEALATRSKELDDEPTPSGNSMIASVLVRLGRIWGDDALVERGVGVLALLGPAMERMPRHVAWALCALDLHLSPPRELAIVGDPRSKVARAALAGFDPASVIAIGPSEEVPLLAGKGLVDGQSAVYVCERFACRAPVTQPDELRG